MKTQRAFDLKLSMLVTSSALMAMLAGCGSGGNSAPVAAVQPAPVVPVPVPAPVPVPVTSGPFGSALSDVKMAYDPSSRRVLVGVNFIENAATTVPQPVASPYPGYGYPYNPTVGVPNGAYPYNGVGGTQPRSEILVGQLDGNRNANLVSTTGSGFTGSLNCQDESCFRASFQVTNPTGPNAGTVGFVQITYPSVPLFANPGRKRASRNSIAAEVARDVESGQVEATLITRAIPNGAKNFFEIQLTSGGSDYGYGYDTTETISISGSDAPRSSIWFSRDRQRGTWSYNNSDSQVADVKLDTGGRLWLHFLQDRGIRTIAVGNVPNPGETLNPGW